MILTDGGVRVDYQNYEGKPALRDDFVLYDADTVTFSHRRIYDRACYSAPVRDPEPLGRSLTGAEVPLWAAPGGDLCATVKSTREN